jgi:hypothetical protein
MFCGRRRIVSYTNSLTVPTQKMPFASSSQGDVVDALTIQHLALACRRFMDLAYPDGPDSIPDAKRLYFQMTPDGALADYLPPGAAAAGICQDLAKLKGGVRGYEFRLGSTIHPHLKLRVQLMNFHERDIWVYSVDTHDRFVIQATKHLSAEHAEQWRLMVEKNGALKHEIEEALAQAGFVTPKGLLRLDLTGPALPMP